MTLCIFNPDLFCYHFHCNKQLIWQHVSTITSPITNSPNPGSWLTHVSGPGEAFSVVAHQCHETCDKLVPLCMSTGTTRGIVYIIPLDQNLQYDRNRKYDIISECKIILLFIKRHSSRFMTNLHGSFFWQDETNRLKAFPHWNISKEKTLLALLAYNNKTRN